ncbi:MAG: hypothetical protein ACXAEE_03490 [Candidatus Thorarchaeota archaeon]|jgi:hypothetical protein
MNESQDPFEGRRFDPPHEGMLPGESIVWSRRAGTGFWVIFFGAMLLMGGPVLTFASLDAFGLSVSIMFGILTLIGFIALLVTLINVRRTRYYLTTDRIVEVRGGEIRRAIPLDHFAGKPLGQFIESRVTHTANSQSVFGIRIYDPVSDEVIELKGLDPNSARAFERIGEIVECPYCSYDNSAMRSQCKNCDAVM